MPGAASGPPSGTSAPETLLAFDYGTRRVGVAVGNSLTGAARALVVIDEPHADPRFAAIASLIAQWQPQRLVVGRPVDDDGSPTATTPRAERFARQLQGRFGVPVAFVDERWSSAEAASNLRAQRATRRAGARHAARGEPDDAEAAAVILRQYLHEHTSRAR